MYNFIKRMYETKRDDGTYIYSSSDIEVLISLGRITADQGEEIKKFAQI